MQSQSYTLEPNTCDTDALNSLLRGELSAVETYGQAVTKLEAANHRHELTRIRGEHEQTVAQLRERIAYYGAEPSTSSGAWGVLAATVTGTAKVLGPQTALAALKQGEEHGIKEYEAALDNDDIAQECRSIIRSNWLPKCREHLAKLDQLIAEIEKK